MKRIFSLLLAVMLLLALLSACQGSGTTTTSAQPTTAATAAPATGAPASDAPTQEPGTTAEPAPPPADEGLYASGKFAVDERGLAQEKYDYPLPLTQSDETFTFWTVCWTPDYISTDYGDTPFPMEHEKRTGVNIEYVLVSGANRSENFSVLLASDDLCDIMTQAESFYPGVFKSAVLDEQYFVNIYDYREYCPNYMYEVAYDRSDDLYEKIFVEDDLVTSFWMLRDGHYDPSGYVMNPEWLAAMGWTGADVVTFDDLHEALTFFDSQFTDYPMTLFKTLEIPGIPDWIAYDTYACVSTSLNLQYVVNGEVRYANMNDNDLALMTMIHQWYEDGLIDPNWSSYSAMTDCDHRYQAGELGYVCMTAGSAPPDWEPIHQPLLYEGQVLHLGCDTTRLGYGSASISARCTNIPLIVSWLDYKYSDEGAILCSYGVEGVTWEYNAEGERELTEFFYNTDRIRSMLACIYMMNTTADPGLFIQYAQYRYPGGESPIRYHEFWNDIDYDGAYAWPTGITLTDEEREEVNDYGVDITTYITENYLAFVDGSKPLDEWDSYVAGLESLGIHDVLAVYQGAYDNYMAQHA